MKNRHHNLAANVGLRAGGAALLGVSWRIAIQLHHVAQTAGARDMPVSMMLLAATAFICGSAGSAMLFVGPHLRDPAEVSERWRHFPPPDGAAQDMPDRGSGR